MLSKTIQRYFTMSTVPCIDLLPYLSEKASNTKTLKMSDLPLDIQQNCKDVALAFHEYGSLAIKDPRANQDDNQRFLDLMETYFQTRSQEFYEHMSLEKLTDCFPEHGFETGVTPEFIEKARDHSKIMQMLKNENKSESSLIPQKDAKWRYMYFIGNTQQETLELSPNVHIPDEFEHFGEIFDKWGYTMLDAVQIVSEMAALGLDLPQDYFTNMLKGGQHLLAPTGSDLNRYNKGTIFAAYHYDFNFLTIHGKSRYPGLYIWLRDQSKIPVIVPDDTLLLQSGRQFEILTGGYIQCGFHEVVYSDKTLQKYQENLSQKGENQWRVSSTLFSHIRHNVMLKPKRHFKTVEALEKYKPLTSYELLEEELKAIDLHPDNRA